MIGIKLKKTDGTQQTYQTSKIITSLTNAGADTETAENIARKIEENIYDGISAKEIRQQIHEELTVTGNEEVANNYMQEKLKVRTDNGMEHFDLIKIANSLVSEAKLSQETAFTIATDVWKQLKKLNPQYLTTNILRELINSKLLEEGLESYKKNYTRLGMPVNEIEKLINNGDRSNANMQQNPETIHKYVADASMKQYALNHLLPHELADGHRVGDYHIHDLDYFAARPLNCQQHDLRVFIKHGLRVDGSGDHTSVAKSPTHLETLMNHTGEILLASQQDMSGGQAMSLWNVFASPFARGRTYEEIKQCVQMLIYNLNMAYASRGSQVPFTSMQLEFGVPKFLQDETAYGPKGENVGTYGDYEEEALQLTRAVTEVLHDGDASGKMHLFPNTIYSLRPETFKGDYEEDLRKVHELTVKYGASYFANMFPSYQGDLGNYMGCLDYDEPFYYKDNLTDEIHLTKIGKYVEDNLISPKTEGNSRYDIVNIHSTLSFNTETGKCEWKPITKVIRNPTHNTHYKITLSNGKNITCTSEHPFYTKLDKTTEAKDLNIGDTIIDIVDPQLLNANDFKTENLKGVLIGLYLGDGTINNGSNIQFQIYKEDKAEYLKNIFDKLELEYSENKHYRERDNVEYTKFLIKITTQLTNDIIHMQDKQIPQEYMVEKYLSGILTGLIVSDGYVRITGKTPSLCADFTTTNPNIARAYKVISDLFGFKCKYTKQVIDKPNHNNVYRLNSSNARTAEFLKNVTLRKEQEDVVNSFKRDMQPPKVYQNTKIIDIQIVPEEEIPAFMYDIEVEDNHNFLAGTGYILSHNCRTHLSNTWTGDWDTDCLRTGNLAYCTINLPRIGYKAQKDEDIIFEELDVQMKKIEQILLIRREQGLKALNEYKILPFISQNIPEEESPYYRIENSTLSFGFNGLNEMLLSTLGANIEDSDANKFGQKVISYINDNANRLKDETGLRWSTIQTPAESTAYRFATLDHEKYPDQVITNGTEGSYYYSNSSHVPVDTGVDIIKKIKLEEPYHRITPGGHIFHAFFGESYGDPESYMSLTEKIVKHSDIGFWAYSSAFSYCMKCHTLMKGLNGKCPTCGETDDVEWYDRITGYMQQVGHAKSAKGGWNNGKKQELVDRTRYQKRRL